MNGHLHDQQFGFTRHLRDPAHEPSPPGLEPRRLQIYRDLVFNNLQALLGSSFPVVLQVLGDTEWHTLCRRYFVGHRCASPLFTRIAAEFVDWLQLQDALPRPFLAELAHYEWVELALQSHDALPLAPSTQARDPWGVPLARSELAWPLAYRWPVQRIGAAFQPATPPPEPTFLLARRGEDTGIVFSQLSPLAWQLLEQIGAGEARTGAAHVQELARGHGLAPADLEPPGRALLAQLLATGVIGAVEPP